MNYVVHFLHDDLVTVTHGSGLQEAFADCDAALDLDPDCLDAVAMRGNVKRLTGDYEVQCSGEFRAFLTWQGVADKVAAFVLRRSTLAQRIYLSSLCPEGCTDEDVKSNGVSECQ